MTATARCPQLYYYNGWVWACILPKGHKTGHKFEEKKRKHTLTGKKP